MPTINKKVKTALITVGALAGTVLLGHLLKGKQLPTSERLYDVPFIDGMNLGQGKKKKKKTKARGMGVLKRRPPVRILPVITIKPLPRPRYVK